VLAGRDFTVADDLQSTPVVIVNETLVRRFFPGRNPIGMRIKPGIGNGYTEPPLRTIVGVVGDVKLSGLTGAVGPQAYVPVAQSPLGSMVVVVHTAVDPLSMVPSVRGAIAAMDRDLPIYNVEPLDRYVVQSLAPSRFVAVLLGSFAAMALALAAIGLYGVVAYSAAQRAHEMGVRLALGAQKRAVLGLVVAQGFKLAVAGVSVGVIGAFALTRFLTRLLYGVRPTDPLTFVAVSGTMIAVALLASYLPARRATMVDPVVALRSE
jgi:putative ABC transport system permease protein